VKIKWLINVAGTVHGVGEGTQAGDVMDVPDTDGLRYCALHYAEPVTQSAERAVKREEKQIERAVAADDDVETATMGAPVDFPPHQVSKDAADPDTVSGPVKRGPGRPPKTT
jgi:hypothetical protein